MRMQISVWVLERSALSLQPWRAEHTADSGVTGVPGDVKQVGRGYLIASCLQRHFSLWAAWKCCYQGATRFTINGLLYAEREATGVKLPSGSNMGRKPVWIFWEQCPSTISSSFDLWTVNAIENLEQRVEERIEAVVINHTTSNIASTHTLTHTTFRLQSQTGWLFWEYLREILPQFNTIQDPNLRQISLIHPPLNLNSHPCNDACREEK